MNAIATPSAAAHAAAATTSATSAATAAATHPLLLVAAGAVTAASLAAIAYTAGWLPRNATEPAATASAPAVATAPVPAVTPTPTPTAPAAVAKVDAGGTAQSTSARRVSTPRRATAGTGAAASPAVTAAGSAPVAASTSTPARELPPPCADCAVVTSVEKVVTETKPTGAGAVIGGIVGGVVGNQIGHGGQRDVARLLGMAGGAYAGHQIEKSREGPPAYTVTVRFEDGTTQRITENEAPAWQAGDKVRLVNGRLLPR